MAKTIRKFNEPLAEKIDEAGVRVLAHKLAGYQIQSTAAPQSPSVQPKLTPNLPDALSVLAHGQLKRLFYYRINIECGNGSVEQLVEDIDPIFWEADSKSVAIAFEQHCLDLEERYFAQCQQQLQSLKHCIRLRKKDIANLRQGRYPNLLPDFGRHYEHPIFEEDDRWIIEGR